MPLQMSQPVQPVMPTEPVGRKTKGTGFTNIQNLLKANVGAAEKMGAGIGQALGKKAGQLKEDVTAAGSKFQQQYGQGVNPAQEALTDASLLIPSSATSIGSEIGTMSEEGAKNLGKKVGEASYSGPMGLEGASQLGSRASSLAGMGDLARSGSMGQGLLLQDVAGRRNPYTRGQTALDTTLLGQSKEAQKSIREGAGQTYGAKQQAETLASSAETQAKQAKDYIKGERSRILGEAAKSSKMINDAAEAQAAEFNQNVSRIKDILSGTINVGESLNTESGNRVIDPEMEKKDRELLSNLSKYGIGTDIEFDASQDRENLIKGLLSQISQSGEIDVGGKYYTPEQQTAARNLALIQQDPVADVIGQNKFNTQAFKNVSNQDLTESQTYKDIQRQATDEKNALNLNQNITQPEVQNLINVTNRTLSLKDATNNENTADIVATTRRPDKIKALMEEDQFLKNAANELGSEKVYQILKNRWDYGRGRDFYGFTNYSVGQLKNSVENAIRQRKSDLNKLNNRYLSKTSLKDYINKKFGINSPSSGGQV
jgi:hypothetical protein